MEHIFTPLRYPGGKGKLAPFIKKVFRHNMLCDGTYIEPYAGGAAVGLSLLLEGLAWNIVINDIDRRVYAFWWSVLHEAENLCRMIHDVTVSVDEWRKQKIIHANIEEFSLLEVGFATFFLNRTNRSGILQAGVIGGLNQDGNYKIDARYNKNKLCERVELISLYKNRISLFNIDAVELVEKISSSIDGKCLFYFDPPYFNKGKMLYRNSYTLADHIQVSLAVRSLRHPWLVTYDDVPEIRNLYVGENQTNFDITYSAHTRRTRGEEVMFYSKDLDLPSNPYTRKMDAALIAVEAHI